MFFTIFTKADSNPSSIYSDHPNSNSSVWNFLWDFRPYKDLTNKMAEKLKELIPPLPEQEVVTATGTETVTFKEAALESPAVDIEGVGLPALPDIAAKEDPPLEAIPTSSLTVDRQPVMDEVVSGLSGSNFQTTSKAPVSLESNQTAPIMKRWEKISLVVFLTSLIGFASGAALAIVILTGDLDVKKDDLKDLMKIFRSSSTSSEFSVTPPSKNV